MKSNWVSLFTKGRQAHIKPKCNCINFKFILLSLFYPVLSFQLGWKLGFAKYCSLETSRHFDGGFMYGIVAASMESSNFT